MEEPRGWLARTLCLAVCVLAVVSSPASAAARTELISVSSAGLQADGESRNLAMTPDARFVAFESYATNLVPVDGNLSQDVFLRDRLTGTTERVSLAWDGAEANGSSGGPAISADGRFVVFASTASNLTPEVAGGSRQVFVRDVAQNTTELVSVSPSGEPANASCDGDFPAISADGRYVFFVSYATNLVPDAPEHWQYVYVRDRFAGVTDIASRGADGEPIDAHYYFAVTPDARFVVFTSDIDLLLRDSQQATTELISVTPTGGHAWGYNSPSCVSADGRFVAFRSGATDLVAGDTNGVWDIFVRDRDKSVTERASVSTEGVEGDAQSGLSFTPPAISADGTFVVFVSNATNLVSGIDGGTFLRDRSRGMTSCPRGPKGQPIYATWSVISPNSRHIAFASGSPDLVPDDGNGVNDIFVLDRLSFEDVPLDHWAFYEVGACNMAGIVQGYQDGLYRPKVTVTRDQMAVYIARAVSDGAVPTGPAQATFPDVPTGHWAYDEIEYAVARSIVEGYGDGTYQPTWEVTRAQMAVFVARSVVNPTGEDGLVSYTPPTAPTFPDVPTWYWSYKHIEYLAEHDIVRGYSNGMYQPTQYVSRDQMAVYVQRAFQLPL